MEQKEREQTKMEQTKMEQQNTEQTALSSCSDPLIIGGHTFTSRFILGSGKYSLDLIQAAVKQAEAQIITLALRRANEGGVANILDYIPSFPTPPAPGTHRRPSGSPVSPGRPGAGIL